MPSILPTKDIRVRAATLLAQNDLTMAEIARRLGKHRQVIQETLAGNRRPSEALADAIAAELGVQTSYLFEAWGYGTDVPANRFPAGENRPDVA